MKIIFKNIILIYFQVKNILKNHIIKHPLDPFTLSLKVDLFLKKIGITYYIYDSEADMNIFFIVFISKKIVLVHIITYNHLYSSLLPRSFAFEG